MHIILLIVTRCPTGGYVISNGITLCPVHHQLAEEYHISGGYTSDPEFCPPELYKKIHSSKEQAIKEDTCE
jgi:hypothetical protein